MIVWPIAGGIAAWLILLALLGCIVNGHDWDNASDVCRRCSATGEHIWRWTR